MEDRIVKLVTIAMLIIVSIRTVMTIYVGMTVKYALGSYGHFLLPVITPIHLCIIMFYIVDLRRELLSKKEIIGLHIFTILYLALDIFSNLNALK